MVFLIQSRHTISLLQLILRLPFLGSTHQALNRRHPHTQPHLTPLTVVEAVEGLTFLEEELVVEGGLEVELSLGEGASNLISGRRVSLSLGRD